MDNLKNKDFYLADKNIVLALSGGQDSIVLLHYLSAYFSANLRVIHCNHHLSVHCDEWDDFCQNICKNLGIDYTNIDVFIKNKTNLEENARNKRYDALFANLKKDEVLCTAHHQNDQAETMLLQLFRGSGVAGLAAMPKEKYVVNNIHYRPLLDINKTQIKDYAKHNNLSWVEDDSNANINFRRNLLRINIIPKLAQTYKNFSQVLARSAKHQAESWQLNKDLAIIDIKKYNLVDDMRLNSAKLVKLDNIRIKNVIRYHLSDLGFLLPSAKVIEQIINLIRAKEDAEPLVCWGDYQARRYRDMLYFIDNTLKIASTCALYAELKDLDGFTIGYRQDGQRVKLRNKEHSQSLKKVLQEAHIEPWMRNNLRMYYVNNKLQAMERIGWLEDV